MLVARKVYFRAAILEVTENNVEEKYNLLGIL